MGPEGSGRLLHGGYRSRRSSSTTLPASGTQRLGPHVSVEPSGTGDIQSVG